jgi:hypothetical protein
MLLYASLKIACQMEVRKAVKTVGIYWLSIGFLPGYTLVGLGRQRIANPENLRGIKPARPVGVAESRTLPSLS